MRKQFTNFKSALERRHLWDIVTYVFFGGLTTVVNIVVFGASTRLGLPWQGANFLAWLLAVLFAFVTNKLWVFHSHTKSPGALAWEFGKFIFARVMSLGIDYACMFLLISVLGSGEMVAKLCTQLVIVVANYAFSKFIIFRHRPRHN